MKKLHLALTIGVAATLCLTSCKKGEDDPFFSLRSRDSRIVGEFTADVTITSGVTADVKDGSDNLDGSISSTYNIGAGYSAKSSAENFSLGYLGSAATSPTFLYEEAESLYMDENEVGELEISGAGSANLNINEDGTYEFSYSYAMEDFTQTINGTTSTSTGDAEYSGSESGRWYWDNSKKNKSGITLVSENANSVMAGTYVINQLKKDDVVLTRVQEKSFKYTEDLDEESYTATSKLDMKILLKGK